MIVRASKEGGPFRRSVRVLAKTWPNVEQDIDRAVSELTSGTRPTPDPPRVVFVPGLGVRALKVRARSTDMQRGQSGGFRVILVLADAAKDEWIRVLAYAKSDREDVSRAEIIAAVDGESAS